MSGFDRCFAGLRLARQIRRLLGRLLWAGSSPRRLALALSLAILLGLMPLPWGTSLLCAALALSLRLNLALMQAVNFALYPLQLVLLPPFFYAGASLAGVPAPGAILSLSVLLDLSRMAGTLAPLALAAAGALLLWLLAALLLWPVLYGLSLYALQRLAHQRSADDFAEREK